MRLEEEFTKAYDQYAAFLLRHITFRVSNESVAQDLTQETFFKAWKHISSKGSAVKIKNFKAFLYKIANNLIIDFYRKKGRDTISIEEVAEKELVYESRQEQEVEAVIEKSFIDKYLTEMKDDYRQILIYRYIDDLSIKEISKITEKSPDNISVIIHRALKVLKQRMTE